MDTATHKVLDLLQHIWPYVSGLVLTLMATARLWWHDRKQTKSRVKTLEILAERMVTQKDLQDCRDEVRHVDEQNLEKIYNEIKANTAENARQHQDILKETSSQSQDIMKQIVRLHQ